MWSRKQLKEQGQKRFVKNYWKCVLAGLVLVIALGRTGEITERFDATDKVTGVFENNFDSDSSFNELDRLDWYDTEYSDEVEEVVEDIIYSVAPFASLIAMAGIIAAVIGIAIKIFLLNPLEVGGRSFFVKNLEENAKPGELGAGFGENYLVGVKTLFLRDIYTFLWTLLLVVPGIIKAYEYRMIPYLLAENPELTTSEAFEISKRMMDGNKWDAFVLDLSFIGWHILSTITAGIVGIFYVNPYQFSTNAALYKTLAGTNHGGDETVEYTHYVEVE